MVPDLSIIIVNTNNKKILGECLASIYQNTLKVSFEIIVTDNGSIDGSQEMIKSDYPQVRLIENKENAGFIRASNQGLRTAKGRYRMLLNDDTITKDSAFDKMIDFMDQNPSIGALGPKLLNVDGTIQRQGGLFGKKFYLSQRPVPVDFVIGACLMVRKEVIDKVGLMDEKLFFYNDDLDWCMSIRKAGWKVYFYPDAEIVHYGGLSSKRVFNRRLFVEGFRGGIYFCKKHYGRAAWIIYRFLLAIGIMTAIPLLILSFPFKREKILDRLLAYFDVLSIAVFCYNM
ncbi:hypothetical protein A2276_05310 [candidate division WOR-1 bacterium RIFOXYA12_FULL_43_27]|uniref:Glycosyltransferase 2-like domain-containing protein n=1 Tax=candidate division WOR-1 bacterium RIFOXYC2_FULL_46_14 TaxID=1802587 RepID=A0A1F4U416_UNCSA|nr:MAG: hypothetical protein A2276_05310 [candidate division WOR-1 bacterium RIFOXYA12_FULL_43_27]OGC20084.1 MAG: hypothetical protein A2292_03315 [candidate division WOR-1 bacterium RIFOXYB2_FULL_46_45]OGC32180.1 MAG: hypothetical protein A2232_08135 [candidate division WOR-1 bacterium RIFOXYA2_FULL_46_56]OGC39580.1 MAG: hypothetical protein A2438_08500 [candidate division WOR-1 bacterium RIFOXYC2_FULL_46_14]